MFTVLITEQLQAESQTEFNFFMLYMHIIYNEIVKYFLDRKFQIFGNNKFNLINAI